MRAARIHEYGGPEVLRVEECEPPRPGPRDVLVRVLAASVNPVDCKIRSGGQRGAVRLRLPAILGLDVSGVVVEAGGEVRGFAAGDEVFSSPTHRRPGTYAEYVAIDEREIARKPAELDHRQAAAIPLCALTAWRCLVTTARLRDGQRALVTAGSGGVGTVAIQIAKHRGAHVTATASVRNHELLRSLGADQVIDYRSESVREVAREMDVVLDATGEREALLPCVRRGGRLVSIVGGLPAATVRYGPNLALLAVAAAEARLRLRGRVRGVGAGTIVRAADGATLAEVAALCARGAIRPVIDRTFALEEIADAHRYSESGRARGKIVVIVGG